MTLALLLAAGVTFVATPVVTLWLRRQNRLDIPNGRSSHTSAVPRGGGLACAFGAAVAWVTASWHHSDLQSAPILLAVAATLLVAGVGLMDDFLTLSAPLRLGVQLIAGAYFGAALGPWWLLAGALAFVVLVNTVNFMDGLNGITSLTMLVFGASLAVLCHRESYLAGTAIGLVTAGTAVGFLPWNAPSARIFLGDVGSYLYGALAAVGILLAGAAGVSVLVAAAPLSVYLFDVSATLVRRAVGRAPLLTAHREHIYQRLQRSGPLPHALIAGFVLVLNVAVAASWLLLPPVLAVATTALALVLYASSPGLATRLMEHRQRREVPVR